MNKNLLFLLISAVSFSSCSSIFYSNCRKKLELENAKLKKENKFLKSTQAVLLGRDSAPSPDMVARACQYDTLAIICADAFITRDSLAKEKEAWLWREKKNISDLDNASLVLSELALKNQALEIKTRILREKLDTCHRELAIFRERLWGEEKKEEIDFKEVLANPYLVSALFYSDEFKQKLSKWEQVNNFARQAIKQILEELPIEFHQKFFAEFPKFFSTKNFSMKEMSPLLKLDFGKGKNHPDAVDLFAAEGSIIVSISDGVVVLAESSWSSVDEESSSSPRGGNSIMIYSPQLGRLYRYAHLAEIYVSVGDIARAGDSLATVGASGKNASRVGRGGHLHLDINQVMILPSGEVKINYLLRQEIEMLLELAGKKE